MIIGYLGDMGNGKTLSAVMDAVKLYHKEGYRIFSNIHLKIIPYTPYDIDDLVRFQKQSVRMEKICFLVDEITLYLDSRSSMFKRNKILTYWVLQSRKQTNEGVVLYTTQYADQIDKRLRNATDITIECFHKSKTNWFLNVISKRTMKGNIVTTRRFNGENWFKYYDTHELVKPPSDEIELETDINTIKPKPRKNTEETFLKLENALIENPEEKFDEENEKEKKKEN